MSATAHVDTTSEERRLALSTAAARCAQALDALSSLPPSALALVPASIDTARAHIDQAMRRIAEAQRAARSEPHQ